jgi:hypothetical protein
VAGRRVTPLGQPLIVLDGGPSGGRWYWLKDWQVRLGSVRAQGFRLPHPAAEALCYRATGRYRDNPHPEYGQGEVWEYVPHSVPPAAPPARVPADGPPVACGTCGEPLFLRRPGRTQCARCDPSQFYRLP